MGVFVHQGSTKTSNTAESHIIPSHIQGVLQEFLRRYDELQRLRHREVAWMMLVVFFSFLCLWSMMFINFIPLSILLNCILLLGLVLALKQYFKVRRISQHEYINVHILYHHLQGKLEVGFCEHESPCQCAEAFRQYIWKRYRISFYGNYI